MLFKRFSRETLIPLLGELTALGAVVIITQIQMEAITTVMIMAPLIIIMVLDPQHILLPPAIQALQVPPGMVKNECSRCIKYFSRGINFFRQWFIFISKILSIFFRSVSFN